MQNERLSQLLQFLEAEPNDAFLKYAVAQAYQAQDAARALVYYRELLSLHSEYLPTYYHAALLLAEFGFAAEAEGVFQKGIVLAQDQGNLKTMREIQNAYQNFLFEQ